MVTVRVCPVGREAAHHSVELCLLSNRAWRSYVLHCKSEPSKVSCNCLKDLSSVVHQSMFLSGLARRALTCTSELRLHLLRKTLGLRRPQAIIFPSKISSSLREVEVHQYGGVPSEKVRSVLAEGYPTCPIQSSSGKASIRALRPSLHRNDGPGIFLLDASHSTSVREA